MQRAKEFQSRAPELLNIAKEAAPGVFAELAGTPHPLGVVLRQECARFNSLVSIVRRSLADLQDAIQGLVVMSAELEATHAALLAGRVPKQWDDAAYPSLKSVASWFADLCERVAFMRRWLTTGAPACFWLGGVFFTQGFLTGLLQAHARRFALPIDTLRFETRVVTHEAAHAAAPDQGAHLSGFFLDGARWDKVRGVLMDPEPGVLVSSMPPMHFLPVDAPLEADDARYEVPVYRTLTRAGTLSTTGISSNFVVAGRLPCAASPQTCIQRGVAIVLATRD
eukprot:gnl/Ergobibamus_cyprinoides/1928.p3 GENE.gnl/Ergobibamus_cyprinoides/1928~~gnl/Ergobibamus_cyprinoides/1928.p3  ORF type:complete len:281 (+),score=72.40 gnl/Ergobibamus_cyprinoides/1928:382-1224(+)